MTHSPFRKSRWFLILYLPPVWIPLFYLGDTVYTYGTVLMDAQVDDPQSPGSLVGPMHRQPVDVISGFRTATGPFSGLDIFTTGVPTPVPGTDILDLVAGDSVVVLGIIARFGGETEILASGC